MTIMTTQMTRGQMGKWLDQVMAIKKIYPRTLIDLSPSTLIQTKTSNTCAN